MAIVGEIILSEWAAIIGRKSLFTPGAHLSAVSGVHDGFIISNECIDLVFCNWGRIQLQCGGNGGPTKVGEVPTIRASDTDTDLPTVLTDLFSGFQYLKNCFIASK